MTADNADISRANPTDRSLAALAEERNELWTQVHDLKIREHDAAELRRVLAARKASLSWRMTAPLRRLAGRLRPRRVGHDNPTPSDTSSARRA
jgi:hypothetical protein